MSEGSEQSSALGAIGAAVGPMVVVRPEVVSGRLVDADVMWVSPVAHLRSGLVAGGRLSDVYGSDIAGLPPTVAAEAALRSPGRQVVVGPYEVNSPAGVSSMYEVSAITYLDMVAVQFIDRTDQFRERQDAIQSQQVFRELIDGLESAVVVLSPQVVDGVVEDAVVEWANQAAHDLWIDGQVIAPGASVGNSYVDSEGWLAAANQAWSGHPSSRIVHGVRGQHRWNVGVQVVTRVGNLLLESTHDRTHDADLLDKLAAAEYRFSSLVEDLPSTVFVGDFGTNRFDFVSPNSIALLGRHPRQLRRFSDLSVLVHPDDRQGWDEVLEWAVSDRPRYAADLRMRRDDGSDFTVSLAVVRRTDWSGADGFLGLMLDVTAQRELLRQLEAGERLQSLGLAAGSIAHDFNNLLMVVAGNIDRARGLVPLAEVPLVEAKRATDQAAKLARDMLTFARSQPGHIGPVYVNDLLGRVVAVASAELPSGVRIVNASATDLPPALVDTAHLEQVVRELVSNACDAVGGGGTVSVSASLVDAARCHLRDDLGPAARYVMVTVADDGPGIPSELMSKVWEPFFTTKSLSTEHGTGLGLSTAHGIVHQYGGHIRLDSGPGHGTTVSFYLPVAETSGG